MIVSPVASPRSTFPVADNVVKEPVPGVLAPILAASIVPPLISAVSATKESIFAVPSMNKSLNSIPLAPRSLAPSEFGKISPPTSRFPFMVVIPAIETPPCS